MEGHVAVSCNPFLKWAGGKRQLLPHLLPRVPNCVKRGESRYFEPFVGGGALFFAVQPAWAALSDSNHSLMATYRAIRDEVDRVIVELKAHAKLHSEKHYYEVRARFGRGFADHKNMAWLAAALIYMNRTGFNGLYRTNRAGYFNVPFGRYANPTICDEERLRVCSKALRRCCGLDGRLASADFEEVEKRVEQGDFVYFDPPYVPLSATASFTAYGKDGFGDADQVRLRDLALRLKRRGVVVVLSNSSAPRVRDLYKRGFKVTEVDARRAVNSVASKRGAVKELIIT